MSQAQPAIEIRDRVIELRRVNRGDVLPNRHNFRTHPDNQRAALKGILKEIGIAGAGLAYYSERNDNKLTYVDGHLRDEEIPANFPVIITDLNDSEADLLLASYDPLSALAQTDKTLLDSLLKDVSTSDQAVAAMLSELAASEGLYFGEQKPPVVEDENAAAELVDRAAELQAKWQTALGQIWECGRHRIVIGDCTDRDVYNDAVQGEKPTIAFLDPPYGMNLDTAFSKRPLTERAKKKHPKQKDYDAVVGDNHPFDPAPILSLLEGVGEQFWWGADYYSEYLPDGGSWLVWDKREGLEDVEYTTAEFELCWSNQVHGRKIIRARWMGLCGTETQDIKTRIHPTQKPLEVYDWLYKRYATPADLIVEPYSGSGSGLVACEKGGYRCAAIEIEPKYAACSLERLSLLSCPVRRVN